MPTSYYSKYVKCPFYHYDSTNYTLCEGCLKKSQIKQIFNNKNQKIEWQEKYCNNVKGYEQCPLYSIAIRKYEDKNG